MNKVLLLGAALLLSASSYAQMPMSRAMVKQSLPTNMSIRYGIATQQDKVAKTANKSVTSGTYYTRPEGAFWVGYNEHDYGFYSSFLNFPAWQDVTFVNKSTVNTGAWHLNLYNTDGILTKFADVSSMAVDGNLVWKQEAIFQYPTPTLVNNKDSFCLGDENINLISENNKRYSCYMANDSIRPHSVADDHEVYVYNNVNYSNTISFGALSSSYLYGNGSIDYTIDGQKANYTCYGLAQYFGKTAAPFYVTSAFLRGYSTSTPISQGDTLKLYIVKSVLSEDQVYLPTSEYLDTLYATSADTCDFKSSISANGKTFYSGAVKFFKKTIDPLTGESSSTGFVIPSDTHFSIVIDGFDQSGIDLGVKGFALGDNNNYDVQNGFCFVANANQSLRLSYKRLAAQVYLNGMYDCVNVPVNGMFTNEPDGVKYNVLRVSADGKTIVTDGFASTGLSGAFVGTTTEWADGDDNENYEFTNYPDWITGYTVDQSKRNDYGGMYIVSFEVEPLPAGTTGRAAVMYVKGKGVTSTDPIYVLQGDASYAAGIEGVQLDKTQSSSALYNLDGQRSVKGTKGILIQNGKKFFNK